MIKPLKKIFPVLFVLFLILFYPSAIQAKLEKIDRFEVKIKINKDATIDVSEKIVYDFGSVSRHGIYRKIPFIKKNKEGKKFKLNYRSFSVTDETGRKYPFQKTIYGKGYLRLKIGDKNSLINGIHTYIINYEVQGGITYFSDHDELYWNITGNSWSIPIYFAQANIILPKKTNFKRVKNICYTGEFGENKKNCRAENLEKQQAFSTTRPLLENEGLTVAVSFPKNIVDYNPAKEYRPFFATRIGQMIFVAIILLWYLLYPLFIVYQWFKNGRDPKVGIPVRAWYDPPKLPNNRSLTPSETGTLIDERVDLKDFFALIIDLAQKGYLKIKEQKKKDFYIQKTKDYSLDSNLQSFERKFLDDFFVNKKEVRLKNKKVDVLFTKIKKLLYSSMVANKLMPKNPEKIRTFYTIMAFLGFFSLNPLLVMGALLFGLHMPRKTKLGAQLKNVALGLKNFLKSQERELNFQGKKQFLFEKLLPYAIAFGAEKQWAKRFSQFNLKQPDWYSSYNNNTFNALYFTNAINHSFSALKTTSTNSSSGFSSGFSGGFSGGGGGGGGGGSW